jgi:hypothetical protein
MPRRSSGRERTRNRQRIPRSALRFDPTDEVDVTLIAWFLTLSPSERLQASANWARLARLRRAEPQND